MRRVFGGRYPFLEQTFVSRQCAEYTRLYVSWVFSKDGGEPLRGKAQISLMHKTFSLLTKTVFFSIIIITFLLFA